MQLVHQAAVTTSQLNPAHKYVPWITVNNVHDDQMQNDAQTGLQVLFYVLLTHYRASLNQNNIFQQGCQKTWNPEKTWNLIFSIKKRKNLELGKF